MHRRVSRHCTLNASVDDRVIVIADTVTALRRLPVPLAIQTDVAESVPCIVMRRPVILNHRFDACIVAAYPGVGRETTTSSVWGYADTANPDIAWSRGW